MTFEEWMKETYGEDSEWDEGWNRGDMNTAWEFKMSGHYHTKEEVDKLINKIRHLEAVIEAETGEPVEYI